MIDLHMHSCYSDDGEFTPEELILKCKAGQIQTMSITDHNCVQASKDMSSILASHSIHFIPGIEIDCVYQQTNFHMLGYCIDFEHEDFEALEQNIRRHSFQASIERLEKTQSLGFHITENELWEKSKNSYWNESWTGELFAEILLAKPEYAYNPLLAPYRPGGKRSDNPYVNFYWDFYSQGSSCYVPVEYPSMEAVIDLIHRRGGLAVLAHPAINLKGHKELLAELFKLPIDGVEAFSSYHTPSQAFHYYQAAKQQGLFVTCGSDFHGKTKPSIQLGQHNSLLSDTKITGQLPFLFRKDSGSSFLSFLEKDCSVS